MNFQRRNKSGQPMPSGAAGSSQGPRCVYHRPAPTRKRHRPLRRVDAPRPTPGASGLITNSCWWRVVDRSSRMLPCSAAILVVKWPRCRGDAASCSLITSSIRIA